MPGPVRSGASFRSVVLPTLVASDYMVEAWTVLVRLLLGISTILSAVIRGQHQQEL